MTRPGAWRQASPERHTRLSRSTWKETQLSEQRDCRMFPAHPGIAFVF